MPLRPISNPAPSALALTMELEGHGAALDCTFTAGAEGKAAGKTFHLEFDLADCEGLSRRSRDRRATG
ncbi:MAG: hypothetical protein U0Q16_19025 [Bryobacteraceae bacterium]